ncbi:MAG: hypothetical protein A2015_01275 [Spirochaetes bacterium GWF1_31_7]|nr:MAG: hypothetical protein A2Y29_01470 [Spirochaetes bacterium GWE2_31_10]OHD52013.1 MAG: hypothetical protein A2015_01275 [Spirochaetes bacterium GWF1_31_7]OHD81061.1 MAG: hypothetical protein A2355_11325 [Spirochaetes bacterium RIFOXYB1_FULL_32_8]HBD94766.1 hypothetical protein [Spirochaetia bacterium]HBI39094.1 hypothetical protein [Spirochaetia bacterium]
MNNYMKIIKLSIPVVLTFLSYHILGITDILMIGKLGRDAIAAVGIALSVYYLYTGPVETFFNSATILMSHAFGRNNNDLLRKYFFHEIVFAVIGASLGLVLAIPLLISLNLYTDNKVIIETAGIYLIISLISLFPYLITVVINRFFMSIQKNRGIAVVSNITVILNIILNYLFIFGKFGVPSYGVAGAAIATIISRFVQLLLNCIFLVREFKKRDMSLKIPVLERSIFNLILKKGIPLAQTSLVEFGSWTIFTGMISRLGTTSMAAHEIALKIKDVGYLIIWSYGVVTTTLVGQACGKGEYETGIQICRKIAKLTVGFMLFFGIIIFIFPEIFLRLFTSDSAVISTGKSILRVIAFYQISDAMFITYRSGLIGMGETKFVRNIILAGGWLVMIPIAFLLTNIIKIGVSGAWIGLVVYVVIAAIICRVKFMNTVWANNEHLTM